MVSKDNSLVFLVAQNLSHLCLIGTLVLYVVRLQRVLDIFLSQMKMVPGLIRQKKTVFSIYFYSKHEEEKTKNGYFDGRWWDKRCQSESNGYQRAIISQIFLSQQNQIICIQTFKNKSVIDLNFDANSFKRALNIWQFRRKLIFS